MKIAKDGIRSMVRVGYDGRVYKTFRGTDADKRFANEIRVLKVLEDRGCDFVPRYIDSDEDTLTLVTSNCGHPVERMSDGKVKEIFGELEEKYGVIHDDQFVRNITYHMHKGRFCVIDFELARVLDMEGMESSGESDGLSLSWAGLSRDGTRKAGNDDSMAVFSSEEGWGRERDREGHINLRDEAVVLAVSDGMGGVKGGDYASFLAVSELRRFLPGRMGEFRNAADPLAVLEEAVKDLHDHVNRVASGNPDVEGMGATLVSGLFLGTELHFAHVGDSRIYHLRDDTLDQLTYDQTRVGQSFRRGEINERQARTHPNRSILSQVIGANCKNLRPQLGTLRLEPGDWLLFCSDGIIDGLWDKKIEEFLKNGRDQNESPGKVAEAMLKEACLVAGKDDTTLFVIEVGEASTDPAQNPPGADSE